MDGGLQDKSRSLRLVCIWGLWGCWQLEDTGGEEIDLVGAAQVQGGPVC